MKTGWVYWIRDLSHTDICSQGYVGVTVVDVKVRFLQHRFWGGAGYYLPEFTSALRSTTTVVEAVFEGSAEEILALERKLRPQPYIGWNRAVGGGGGCGLLKHGLTGSGISKIYYNVLTRARQEGIEVSARWLGENGLETFAQDMGECPARNFILARRNLDSGYSKENCLWEPRQEFFNRVAHSSVVWNGKPYSRSGLARELGIKPNTFQYRLMRGWSFEEAIGLKGRDKRLVRAFDGSLVRYDGSLTDDELAEVIELRVAGTSLEDIAALFGLEASNMSRICKRLGVKVYNAS